MAGPVDWATPGGVWGSCTCTSWCVGDRIIKSSVYMVNTWYWWILWNSGLSSSSWVKLFCFCFLIVFSSFPQVQQYSVLSLMLISFVYFCFSAHKYEWVIGRKASKFVLFILFPLHLCLRWLHLTFCCNSNPASSYKEMICNALIFERRLYEGCM